MKQIRITHPPTGGSDENTQTNAQLKPDNIDIDNINPDIIDIDLTDED